MRLTNTGLGLGTTAPSEKLHILSGSILLDGPSVKYKIKRAGYDEYISGAKVEQQRGGLYG